MAAALGLASGLCLAPDATNRLRDDAFYEFAWAANLAAGHGPTVSDGVTTSGVQLLWSLLLVPVVWLGGAACLPAVAPWLGFLLHAATALLWSRAARSRCVGACLGVLWLGHPLLVRESQNGQETALACLLATALWLGRRAGERWFTGLAVLAVAARSDLWFVVVLLSLWRRFRIGRHGWPAPVAALLVHLAANLLLGGGLFPDSALPMAWLWHANAALADPAGAGTWQQVWWYARPVLLGSPFALASACGFGYALFVLLRPWWPAAWRALPAVGVGVASACGARDLAVPAWGALFVALLPASGRRPLPRAFAALALGLAAIVALHWAVRWYPRDYYVAPLVVVAFAAIARHGRLWPLLVVFAAAQVVAAGRARPEPLGGQIEMELAGQYLAEVLPAGERVGSFNSGIVTFRSAVIAPLAQRREVVNLDGVVDARTFAALRRGELGHWLDREGVRFLLDNPVQFATDPRLPHASGHWIARGFAADRDLREIARFDVPGSDNGRPGGDSLRLYWRVGRGEPPLLPAASRDLGVAGDGARIVAWAARAGELLQCVAADGERHDLLRVDVDTTVVLRLPPEPGGRRLFVAGRPDPVLVLPPL